MKEVKVKIKSVNGVDEMFPACPESQFLCDILGAEFLTERIQNIIKRKGWNIIIKQDKTD